MPVVATKEIHDRAPAERYGVAPVEVVAGGVRGLNGRPVERGDSG